MSNSPKRAFGSSAKSNAKMLTWIWPRHGKCFH